MSDAEGPLPLFKLHAVVSGHVQGVGFRAYTAERAEFLGLTGWVRNTFAGDVEVTAEGPRHSLDILLAALRKGPRGSHVIDVRFDFDIPSGTFREFTITRTV
jgi:acylphosphatase